MSEIERSDSAMVGAMVSSQCQVSPGGVLRPTTPRGLIGSHRGVYAFRQFGHGGLASLGLRPSPEPSCAAQEDISRGHIMASHALRPHNPVTLPASLPAFLVERFL